VITSQHPTGLLKLGIVVVIDGAGAYLAITLPYNALCADAAVGFAWIVGNLEVGFGKRRLPEAERVVHGSR